MKNDLISRSALIEFEVIDNQTGRYPNCELIAVTEEWAKRLVYCDIDCFAITEDGTLLLIDDCNNIAYPPRDRFTVKFDPESLRPKGKWKLNKDGSGTCSECRRTRNDVWDMDNWDNFCSHCGAEMKGVTKCQRE